jgi:YidC/Oxa1 family membrane protein insertase
MLGILDAGVSVIYPIVTAMISLLAPIAGGFAAVAAIVLFTIAVRLLLVPLSFYAMRGQAAQARLLPQVQELRRKHASQPDRLQRELTALYQREGTGVLAGCLPLLLQWPALSLIYRLFLTRTVSGHQNSLLAHTLLGVPLGSTWLGAGPLGVHGLVFAGLFAALAAAGWLSVRSARRAGLAGGPANLRRTAATGSARTGQPEPDATARLLARLPAVLPYLSVVIAAFVPLAAGVYLLTTTLWTVGERAVLRRRIPGPPLPPAPAVPAGKSKSPARGTAAAA